MQEISQTGLKAVKARGKMGDRLSPLLDNRQIHRMVELYDEGKSTVAEV